MFPPGTLATGSLTARALGNGSGGGVGQTSSLTVGRASEPEFHHFQDHGAGGSVNRQTSGLTTPEPLRREMSDGGAFPPLLLTQEGGEGRGEEARLV